MPIGIDMYPAIDNSLAPVSNSSSSGKDALSSDSGSSFPLSGNYQDTSGYYSSGLDAIADWLGIGSAGRQYDANQKLQAQQNMWDKYMTDQNNAFNSQEAAAAREYSEKEAKEEREWQEFMSNTAYQRAVADLQKAGLNPILATGSPATSGAGAMGQISTAYASPYAKGSLGSMMSLGAGLQGIASLITSGLMAYNTSKTRLSSRDKKSLARKLNLTDKEATFLMRLAKVLK